MPTGLPLSTTNSAVMRDALMSSSAADASMPGEIVFGRLGHDVPGLGAEQRIAHVTPKVAVGHDTDELALRVHDAEAAEALRRHGQRWRRS